MRALLSCAWRRAAAASSFCCWLFLLLLLPLLLPATAATACYRFGGYLVFTVTVAHTPRCADRVAELVQDICPTGARLTYALGGTFKYELPTSSVSLSKVFSTMAALAAPAAATAPAAEAAEEEAEAEASSATPDESEPSGGSQRDVYDTWTMEEEQDMLTLPSLRPSSTARDYFLEAEAEAAAAAAAVAAAEAAAAEAAVAAAAAAAADVPLRVLDWGVSNATLEDVFIRLAHSAGAYADDAAAS